MPVSCGNAFSGSTIFRRRWHRFFGFLKSSLVSRGLKYKRYLSKVPDAGRHVEVSGNAKVNQLFQEHHHQRVIVFRRRLITMVTRLFAAIRTNQIAILNVPFVLVFIIAPPSKPLTQSNKSHNSQQQHRKCSLALLLTLFLRRL